MEATQPVAVVVAAVECSPGDLPAEWQVAVCADHAEVVDPAEAIVDVEEVEALEARHMGKLNELVILFCGLHLNKSFVLTFLKLSFYFRKEYAFISLLILKLRDLLNVN